MTSLKLFKAKIETKGPKTRTKLKRILDDKMSSSHGTVSIFDPWRGIIFKIFLFVYLCRPQWVFEAVQGLSLVAANGDYSSLQCMGFSLWWLLLLQSMGL